jgi:uncharacterized protein YjbI with pentapeptide repeats
MLFQITNRWTGFVQFECELTAEIAGQNCGLKLGFAVKKAYESGADLCGADLSGASLRAADLRDADLSGASLRDADLRAADLRGASLRGASLRDADLSDASLRAADLRDADLRGASLRDASLRDADLSDASLRDADLRDADLRGASLRGASLRDADLSDASLRDADLRDADLSHYKQDLIAEVLRLPNELEALRDALCTGRIDGSTYSGECSCLAGTLAKAHGVAEYRGWDINASGVTFHAQASSPRERWFAMIREGDTPETNQASRLALEWVDEAIAIRNNIRATMVGQESV